MCTRHRAGSGQPLVNSDMSGISGVDCMGEQIPKGNNARETEQRSYIVGSGLRKGLERKGKGGPNWPRGRPEALTGSIKSEGVLAKGMF